jgi:DNA-binding LacI/PurR family transcriptional regulator
MKYLDLYSKLKAEIDNGTYTPGSNIPHTNDLIKKYKLSLTTISKAVKLLEREGYVKRIKSKGTFVLERETKNFLNMYRGQRIGLLVDGYIWEFMDMHFFRQTCKGIERVLSKADKSIIIIPREKKSIRIYLREIEANQISGLIVFSFYDKIFNEQIKSLKLPMVYCDFMDHNLDVTQVTADDARAGAIALKKLIELGHTRIFYFGGCSGAAKRKDADNFYRWQGVDAQAKLGGIKHVYAEWIPWESKMKQRVQRAVDTHPDCTGYICASITFYEYLKEILESHPKYEKDSRDVVLFSDLKEELKINNRKIFQCRWDTHEMGIVTANKMLEILKGGPYKPAIYYMPVEIFQS